MKSYQKIMAFFCFLLINQVAFCSCPGNVIPFASEAQSIQAQVNWDQTLAFIRQEKFAERLPSNIDRQKKMQEAQSFIANCSQYFDTNFTLQKSCHRKLDISDMIVIDVLRNEHGDKVKQSNSQPSKNNKKKRSISSISQDYTSASSESSDTRPRLRSGSKQMC